MDVRGAHVHRCTPSCAQPDTLLDCAQALTGTAMKLKAVLPLVLGTVTAGAGAVLYFGGFQIGLGIFCSLMGLSIMAVGVRRALVGALKAARRQQESTRKTAEQVVMRQQEIRKISDRLRAIKDGAGVEDVTCALPGFRPPQVPPQPKPSLLLPCVLAVGGLLLVLFYQPLTAPLRESALLYKLEQGAYENAWIEPWSADFALVERADEHRDRLLALLAAEDPAVARGAARVLLAADPYGEVVPDSLFGRFVGLNRSNLGQLCQIYTRGDSYQVYMKSIGEFWAAHLWRRRGLDAMIQDLNELKFYESSYGWDMGTNESGALDAELDRILVLASRNVGGARRQLEALASGQRPRLPAEARQIALLLIEELREGPQSFHDNKRQLIGLPTFEILAELATEAEAVVGTTLLAEENLAVVAYGGGLLQLVEADLQAGTLTEVRRMRSEQDFTCFDAHSDEVSGVRLLTGSTEGSTGYWTIDPKARSIDLVHFRSDVGAFVSAVALSPRTDYAVAGQAALLRLFYLVGAELRRVNAERLAGELVNFATFGEDGNSVLLGTDAGHLMLGGVRHGRLLLDGTSWRLGGVATVGALLHDGTRAFLGMQSGEVQVRRLDVPAAQSIPAHGGSVLCLAVSENERWLLTGSEDGSAVFWELDAVAGICAPRGMLALPQGVRSVALSSDGGRALLGLLDGRLILCTTAHLQLP